MTRRAHLRRIDWPDYGLPDPPPPPTLAALRANLEALRAALRRWDLTHLVIYADREHCANMLWATGFDPRFEEAVLILPASGSPALVVGNECFDFTPVSALVRAGDIRPVLCPSLSLISQPRRGPRLADVLAEEIAAGARIGAIGWKYFGPDEVDDPAHALDLPAFVADPLRALAGAGNVTNATDLMMHPGHGLRATVTADEIAAFEFANAMASRSLRSVLFALREGMTDFEACAAAALCGLPLSCHMTFATGATARLGLSGPTGQRLRRGETLAFNVAHFGANICRAGWIATGPEDLPEAARDYVDAFAGPYLAALADWFALMTPGTPGGAVQAAMDEGLPFETFGVTLNPGHLIHHDEWLSSPIFPGSDLPLRSGMALQVDVIPSHPAYGSTRMEEGVVIADEGLRAALAAQHPALIARAQARRAFLRETIGIETPDSLLPLSDTAGIITPFLLAPNLALTLG